MTNPIYAEPSNPALPDSGFELDLRHAALIVTDPQIDFLSPDGVTWAVFGDSIQENGTVAHIGELFDAAKAAGITARCRRITSIPLTRNGSSAIHSRSSWTA